MNIKNLVLKIKFLSLLLSILLVKSAFASLEVISLVDKNCQAKTGFIVGSDETNILFMKKDGSTESKAINSIESLVIHNLVDYPGTLASIGSETPWYEITLLNSDRTTFSGVPIQFIDDLVVFLNRTGKPEVISLDQIRSIELSQNKSVQWKGINLDLNMGLPMRCPGLSRGNTYSTRVLSDQVQISEFLQNYQVGFEKFYHLKERMNFYALPRVIQPSVRMGFVIAPQNGNPEMPNGGGVINFKIASSVPFGLQSSSEFLTIRDSFVPFYFPFLGASFQIKSHLFHALLVANFSSISGGSSFFENLYKFPRADALDNVQGSFYEKGIPMVSQRSFNYLTMFGMDWKQWSISVGGYYPIHFIHSYSGTREYLSNKPQPTMRLMYTVEDFRIRGIASKFDNRHNVSGDAYSLVGYNSFGEKLDQDLTADSKGSFARIGIDTAFKTLKLKLDTILYNFEASDSTGMEAKDQSTTLGFSVGKDFGKYVSLNLFTAQTLTDWKVDGSGGHQDRNSQDIFYGGEFEFLF